MALKLHNSLVKETQDFSPINDLKGVGVYACGPTVYDYVHIGNWRTYTLADITVRALKYNGYKVNYFMNITDVGHLTGDNLGDADTGEDRMEKAKNREGKDAWAIARFYENDFKNSYTELNLSQPNEFLVATEHIQEQIDLVQKLFANNLAYQIADGIYFDTKAYEDKGYRYGELSNLDHIKEGARVEANKDKRNPRDFALWKFSPTDKKRDMEWQSPWGLGFPGWHIECSAMSMKALGEQFDIHLGGEDLKSTHHPNEIAQSQGATNKHPFVKYWLHGAFLQVDNGRMGKSLGNAYNLSDLKSQGYNPLSLRYFYLSAHYSSSLNFTWEALSGAEKAFKHLQNSVLDLGQETGIVSEKYKNLFLEQVNDDLNMPRALSVVWEVLKDEDISNSDKKATVLDFDAVLGLSLGELFKEEIPENILLLVQEREKARQAKDWQKSDNLREQIKSLGYDIKDTDSFPVVRKS